MLDLAALDRAVRRCRLLLSLCRKQGINLHDVAVMRPLIVGYYKEECRHGNR